MCITFSAREGFIARLQFCASLRRNSRSTKPKPRATNLRSRIVSNHRMWTRSFWKDRLHGKIKPFKQSQPIKLISKILGTVLKPKFETVVSLKLRILGFRAVNIPEVKWVYEEKIMSREVNFQSLNSFQIDDHIYGKI